MEKYLLLVVLGLSLLVRLYDLPEHVTFGGDQGIDLLAVKKMVVDHQFTLLGPKTSMTDVYNGPLYYYLIAPVLWIAQMNPLSVSVLMIGLWVAAFYLMWRLAKDIFNNWRVGFYGIIIFSFWPISIEYSRMAFSSFPTPLFSIAFVYTAYLFRKYYQLRYLFASGILTGFLLQLHYTNVSLVLLICLLGVIDQWSKWKKLIITGGVFLGGLLFALLPMILFELRHQFFNTKMFIKFVQDPFYAGGSFQIHYLIAFFPVIFLLIGFLIYKLDLKWKHLGKAVFLILISWEVSQINIISNTAYTMPSGWNYLGVEKAAQLIISDIEQNQVKQFNIASIIDGDTRAHPFRYLLEVGGAKPLGVENYPQAEVLYVVGKCNQQITNYPVWEIQSFLPDSISKHWLIQSNYCLFRLNKSSVNQD